MGCAPQLDVAAVLAVAAVVLSLFWGASSDVFAGPYPKINLAAGYKVDPTWPAKPPEVKWRYMTGIAVDAKDRVWTLNAIEPQVQVYSVDGTFLHAWGGPGFKNPHHIVIDRQGNVWITDYGLHVVQKFTEKGKLLLTLGTPNEPGADATHFNRPTAAAVTPTGDVFVTDGYGNNRVVHFDAQGSFVKMWGKLGVKAGELSQPHSLSVDSKGRLYVGERNNCRIQIFDQNGRSMGQWRNLVNPWGTWITPDDQVYVCGSSPKRWGKHSNLGNPPTDQLLMKLDTTGRVLSLWTFPLVKPGQQTPGHIDWIHGLAVDSHGNVYVGDVSDNGERHRAQKFVYLAPEG
jgi:sugar lactone lactonase YvrE